MILTRTSDGSLQTPTVKVTNGSVAFRVPRGKVWTTDMQGRSYRAASAPALIGLHRVTGFVWVSRLERGNSVLGLFNLGLFNLSKEAGG